MFSPLRDRAEADSRPSAAEGLTFWSGGDSTSYYMSIALTQTLVELGAIPLQPEPEYENGSGLRSVDFFDWHAHIRDDVAPANPDIVFFMIGANDATDGLDLDVYRAQVGDVMNSLAGVRYAVWVGQPTMADPDRAARVQDLNAIFRSEAQKRSWVRFVDVWRATADSTGAYAAVLPDENGVNTIVRAEDGLHFTPEGGRLLARAVLAELFGL
jgi:hypothetical protein